ncbi:class I tRNA ligase family protein, partial [Chloroflexota bacterium]
EVFTTRPDTLWGATFMVLAPEHPLVKEITAPEQQADVQDYANQAIRQTDIQRESAEKDKSGVFTGGYAVNPVNEQRIPIWIADYVLMTYGTGAIMAVPAHDERDFEFALKFGLPILPVIDRTDGLTKSFVVPGSMGNGFMDALSKADIPFSEDSNGICLTLPMDKIEHDILARCKEIEAPLSEKRTLMEMLWGCEFYRDALYHDGYGAMINSENFSGTPGETALNNVIGWLEQKGAGKGTIIYRIRDWLISRQRYWGTPIPIVYCSEHGAVPIPDDQLPVLLPDDVEWLPTGESPLKLHPTWKYTSCPVCDGPAERETDTMDTFMCSSWYHLRYLSPDYDRGPFDLEEYDYWMPVDTYTGGIEHATMHLIYTRFFHKAGRDMGIMKDIEPMLQLRNQGIILGEDSEKMSKSRGNVISPDDLLARYGADTIRAYLMFFARWDLGGPWNSSGIGGAARWIKRTWTLYSEQPEKGEPKPELLRSLRRKLHQTLYQVTHDFETFEFNTIVSALMELLNEMYRARDNGAVGTPEWDETLDIYLRMMAPVTPHVAEELWVNLGKPYSIHTQPWPETDDDAMAEEQITLVVQVNGKVRDRILVNADIDDQSAEDAALASETVKQRIGNKPIRKVIVVSGKLVNIVV